MSGSLATQDAIDRIEAAMAQFPSAEFPVTHRFTPGLYIRETLLPKDTMMTSMEHLREHPFVISKGEVRVISENEGEVIYEAPYTGITKPHTRRVLHAIEDTIWTTFHVTELTDVEAIAAEILAPHDNPLLPDGAANQWRHQLPTPETPCLGSP